MKTLMLALLALSLIAVPAVAQQPPGQVMYAWAMGNTLFVSFLDGVPPGAPLNVAFPGTGCAGGTNCIKVTQGSTVIGETLGNGNVPPCPKLPCPPVPGQVTGPYNLGFCRLGDPSCPEGHMWSYIVGHLKPVTAGTPIVVTYDGKLVATIPR